jgi:hypothetical protein
MAKKIKVVDHLEWYVTNEKFQVTLDIGSGQFQINLESHDHIIKGDVLEKVKADAMAWLKGNAELDMKPVIVVRMSDPIVAHARDSEHALMLNYERCFVGVRKDKQKIWKKWQDTGSIPEGEHSWLDCVEGKASSQSERLWDEAHSKIIPYTIEKWKALRKISKLIRIMNTRLEEIVESKDLEGFLLDLYKKDMIFALPAPKGKS